MADPGEMDLSMQVSKSVLARFATAGVGFVGTIIFARVLGPRNFGGYTLLIVVLTAASTPVQGWISAVKKRISEHQTDNEELFGAFILSVLVVLALLLVSLFLAGSYLVAYTGLENAELLVLSLFVPTILFSGSQQLLSATGYVSVANWNDTFRAMMTFSFRIALILAGLGVAGMVYGLAGSSLVAVAVSFFYLRLRPKWPSWQLINSLYRYGKYSIVIAVVGQSYARLDQLILGYFLGQSWVGYYEVAAKLTIPGLFVSGPIIESVMPKVSNLDSRGEDVAEHVSNGVAFASILSIPIFFGAAALPESLVVTTYSAEYRSASLFIVGIAAYRLIDTQTDTLQTFVNGVDMPKVNAKVNTVTVAVNLLLGIAFVIEFGAVGVVVASVFAEALRYAMSAYAARQIAPEVELFPPLLRSQVVAGTLMFAIVRFANELVVVRSWITLLALVGIGAAVYWTVLVVLSQTLRSTFHEVIGKYDLP